MNIYADYYHQGKSLEEWRKELNGEFSLGELYRMAKEGVDFPHFVLSHKGIVSEK